MSQVIGYPVEGVTPVIDDPFKATVRFYEVRQYLNNLSSNQIWIAIDDCRGFYPVDTPVHYTNTVTGFTAEDGPALL